MSKKQRDRSRVQSGSGYDQASDGRVEETTKDEYSRTSTNESTQDKRHFKKGKGKNMGKRKPRERGKVRSTNDITWYSANPDLLRDSAAINFSWPTGNQYLYDSYYDGQVSYINKMKTVPGVASIELRPTYGNIGFGGTSGAVDPITVASKHVFSYLRADNTGSSPYDAPDLMIYLLCMSSVYSFVSWCRRLYAYLSLFDGRNKYMPRMLIQGNGVDYDSLMNNMATFRFWLNTFVKKVSAFAVPANIYLFYRKAFLYQHVYTEGSSIKSQLYQFVPKGFEQFKIDDVSFMGSVVFEALPNDGNENQLLTVDQIIAYGESMFAKLWNQQDFGIMSGDILKKYGDNILKIAPIDVDLTIAPVFDPLVLYQIKNGTWLPVDVMDISNLLQTPDGVLQYSIHTSGTGLNLQQVIPPVLTVDMPEVPPEVVMEMTRLTAGWADNQYGSAAAIGTEIISNVRVANWPTGSYNAMKGVKLDSIVKPTAGFNASPDIINFIGLHSQFKYLPRQLVITEDEGGSSYVTILHDIDNYAVADHTFLAKVHEAALLNMLDVPSVGKAF